MASKSIYPDIWSDDEQMNVMFSHFRQSRDINPRSWDSKLKFWTQMILDECVRSGDVIVDTVTMPSRFMRDGRTPKCLGRVFHEMHKNDEIVPLEEFIKETNLNMLTWAFDRMVVTPVKWGWQSFLGGESVEEITEGRYIVWSLLKSLSVEVEKAHQSHVKNPLIDHILGVETLLEQCGGLVREEETLCLVLLWLHKLGRVHLIYGQQGAANKIRAVKFAHRDMTTVTAVNEFDRKVLKLKQTETELEIELDKNYVEMEKALAEAKRFVREGQKANARSALRVKKKCEDMVHKRSQALANVQDILSKIRDSHADRMIVEAYEAGADALRASNKAAPQTAAVDNIMTELEQLFEEEEEIKASLTVGRVGEGDVSLSELEAELDEITADTGGKGSVPADQSKRPQTADRSDDSFQADVLPSVPVFDPSETKRREQEPLSES